MPDDLSKLVHHDGFEAFFLQRRDNLTAVFHAFGFHIDRNGDIAHRQGTAYARVIHASNIRVILRNDARDVANSPGRSESIILIVIYRPAAERPR